MAARKGKVYILRAIGTPRVKIGWTNNLTKRINALKTGCPYPVDVIATIESDDASLEREVHNIYQNYRVHGEWFELPAAAIDWLKSANDKDIMKVHIARFLMKKDLAYALPISKVDEIRQDMSEVLCGCGA